MQKIRVSWKTTSVPWQAIILTAYCACIIFATSVGKMLPTLLLRAQFGFLKPEIIYPVIVTEMTLVWVMFVWALTQKGVLVMHVRLESCYGRAYSFQTLLLIVLLIAVSYLALNITVGLEFLPWIESMIISFLDGFV